MYCLKCRAKREGREHTQKLIKNGRRTAIVAYCEVCGTVMYTFEAKKKPEIN